MMPASMRKKKAASSKLKNKKSESESDESEKRSEPPRKFKKVTNFIDFIVGNKC